MASSSSHVGLTKSKELGKYTEGSGDGRPQRGGRTSTTERVALAKECSGCEKHIEKVKISLVCSCKEAVYCSEDCKSSSSHDCREEEDEDWCLDEYEKVVHECYLRYKEDQEMRRGPSSDKIEKLMKRSRGDQEHLLVLAEAGDPVAAFVVGEAFADRRVDGRGFKMPRKYLDKSYSETSEIAMKWLKIAAEGGVPEGMYLLSVKLDEDNGLVTDRRLAQLWRAAAYGTGKMDYVLDVLERNGLAKEFKNISEYLLQITCLEDRFFTVAIVGPTLSHLLMASRWEEIKNWNGKTGMGEPFFGQIFFRKLMENLGWDLQKKDAAMSSLVFSENKSLTIRFISGRHGSTGITGKMVPKLRNENNLKLKQGVITEFSPDYQLIIQTSENGVLPPIQGRTAYQVNCKHDEGNIVGGDLLKSSSTQWEKRRTAVQWEKRSYDDCQLAGECHLCSYDALQRLKAVAKGLYSVSINQLIPDYGYAARYLNEDGVIVQDVFKTYSKPDVRQMLQCFMSNPSDLHPAAVAEDQNLYWPIVWHWGSVFHAVKETCGKNTLDAIYEKLGEKITLTRSEDASSLAAFPESAAGEWRVACGSEDCPRVDHDVKFNLCRGCKVRRYCNEDCQRNDWPKHKPFCKAAKRGSQLDS